MPTSPAPMNWTIPDGWRIVEWNDECYSVEYRETYKLFFGLKKRHVWHTCNEYKRSEIAARDYCYEQVEEHKRKQDEATKYPRYITN